MSESRRWLTCIKLVTHAVSIDQQEVLDTTYILVGSWIDLTCFIGFITFYGKIKDVFTSTLKRFILSYVFELYIH